LNNNNNKNNNNKNNKKMNQPKRDDITENSTEILDIGFGQRTRESANDLLAKARSFSFNTPKTATPLSPVRADR
jgi:hypothetical protein